jgi:hypothetical protein
LRRPPRRPSRTNEQEALNLCVDVVDNGGRDSPALQMPSGDLDDSSLEVTPRNSGNASIAWRASSRRLYSPIPQSQDERKKKTGACDSRHTSLVQPGDDRFERPARKGRSRPHAD